MMTEDSELLLGLVLVTLKELINRLPLYTEGESSLDIIYLVHKPS